MNNSSIHFFAVVSAWEKQLAWSNTIFCPFPVIPLSTFFSFQSSSYRKCFQFVSFERWNPKFCWLLLYFQFLLIPFFEDHLRKDILTMPNFWLWSLWERFHKCNRHHNLLQSIRKSGEWTYQRNHLFAILQHWLGLEYIWETHQEDRALHTEQICWVFEHTLHNYKVQGIPIL